MSRIFLPRSSRSINHFYNWNCSSRCYFWFCGTKLANRCNISQYLNGGKHALKGSRAKVRVGANYGGRNISHTSIQVGSKKFGSLVDEIHETTRKILNNFNNYYFKDAEISQNHVNTLSRRIEQILRKENWRKLVVEHLPIASYVLSLYRQRNTTQLQLLTEFLNFRTISRIWASKDNEKKDDKPLQDKSGKESSAGGGPNNNNNKDDDNDNDKLPSLLAKAFLWMLTAYMFIAIISLMFPGSSQPEVVRYVSWNEFVHHMLAKGEVDEIIVRPDVEMVSIVLNEGAIVKGRRINPEHKTFHMNIVDMNKFEAKLRDAEDRLGIRPESRVPVIYERSSDTAGKLLASIIIGSLIFAIMLRNKTFKSPISMDAFSQMTRARFTLVEPLSAGRGVKFSDVAGLKEAKQEVLEFVSYLKKPEVYQALGAKVPQGLILLGPPGCGKTMLAKAIATEASVPFLSMNGSEFIEMIGGLGAARVRDLFKQANKRKPCIIYIDEIDAIGRKRSQGGLLDGAAGESEQTLNQLLVEMDGMASNKGVLVLASTNRAEVLDKALLRPGRFDRHVLIDLPNIGERKEIFEHHLKSVKLERNANTYSRRMSQLTPGFSGADIANVVNEAALHAATMKKPKVTGDDLEFAMEKVVGGTEKRTHVMNPKERRIVAIHESGHALVGWLLETTDALLKVTIVPRTNHALGFASYLPSDQKLYNTQELFEKMCMALGGRAAEALTFNSITTGAQNDLEKVTKIAYAQIRAFGMNEKVGPISFTEEETGPGSKKPFSKQLRALMDDEASRLVAQAYRKTEEVLTQNRDKLEKLADALMTKETLNYDEVELILGPPPFGKKNLIGPEEFEVTVNEQAGVPKDTTTTEPVAPEPLVPEPAK